MRLLICVAVFAMSGTGAGAVTIIVTPETFATSIETAKPGDRVVLAPGDYGTVRVIRKTFQPPLEIYAGVARLDGVQIDSTTGIRWKGGVFGPVETGGKAVSVDNSKDVAVTNVTISGVDYGVVFHRSQNVALTESRISQFRVDGVRLFCVQGGRVAYVSISDAQPVNPKRMHPDGIQLASACGPTENKITSDITIEDNSISVASQGLTAFHHKDDDGYDRIVYQRNKIATTFPHALTLQGCRKCTVIDNEVSSLPGYLYNGAAIHLEGTSGKISRNRLR